MTSKVAFKMASLSKRPRVTFIFEEVAEICARDGSDTESDVDSNTGRVEKSLI